MVDFVQVNPWDGKTAIVLGANSPIGVAVVQKLMKNSLSVVAVDMKMDLLENLEKHAKFRFIKTDLGSEDDIIEMFVVVEEELGGADLLVNLIEVLKSSSLLDCNTTEVFELWNRYVLCGNLHTREIIRSMKDRRIELGQIINILNFSENIVPKREDLQLYNALKRVVTTSVKYLREELDAEDVFIRVSTISTVFENAAKQEQRNGIQPTHFADAVEYIINLPYHIQVRDIVLESINNEDDLNEGICTEGKADQ